MIRRYSLLIAAMLLFSAGSGVALAQNGPRGNRTNAGGTCPRADCPNPGQNCPRNGTGPCARTGRGLAAGVNNRPMAMRRGVGRGAGMANCPRR